MRIFSLMQALLILLVGCGSATADVIYESATFTGIPSSGGLALDTEQYLGVRFTIAMPVQVTAVGGDIGAGRPGGIFGVILSLSGPNALPSGSPFDDTTIASVVFQPPFPPQDVSIPLSALLQPGTYGLVFGGGEFGSRGEGFLDTNNFAGSGLTLLQWSVQNPSQGFVWIDNLLNENEPPGNIYPRFVVYGTVVPEPMTAILMSCGLIALVLLKSRRKPLQPC